MSRHGDWTIWHCRHEISGGPVMYCPDEGCPWRYGCARDHGWKRGDPSPPECRGQAPDVPSRAGEEA